MSSYSTYGEEKIGGNLDGGQNQPVKNLKDLIGDRPRDKTAQYMVNDVLQGKKAEAEGSSAFFEFDTGA